MNKDEFNMKKELLELEHVNKMKELEYVRGTEQAKFDWKMQVIRLETANRNRLLERKEAFRDR
jgi:galactose-1-phosphate uridylyltransferase